MTRHRFPAAGMGGTEPHPGKGSKREEGGARLRASCYGGHHPKLRRSEGWWRRRGLNPRPPRCERGALPAELLPHLLAGKHSRRFRSALSIRAQHPRARPRTSRRPHDVASPQGASPVVPPVSPTVGVPQRREARIGASGRGSPAASSELAIRSSPRLLPSCIRPRNILTLKMREVSAGSAQATFAPGTPLRRAL
jgi:hypothetical protein